MSSRRVHLAIALNDAGWHPAAWRDADARPGELLSAAYWVDQVRAAEAAFVDFVTIEDGLTLQSSRSASHDDRTDLVRGRLDAVMIAARVAPLTRHVGLIPSVTVTHTEPFHISKAIATLDYISNGRAGVRVQVSGRAHEAAHFGRRTMPAPAEDLFEEAGDYVEVVRRLWDSWEDDAEIRDLASGRFVDRRKLHYIDFRGRWFAVKGPSITPRPPQGQPLVAALAHSTLPYRFATASADIVYVTPMDSAGARAILDELVEVTPVGRDRIVTFADLVVFLGRTEAEADDRKARLDAWFGKEYRSDAHVFVGTATGLADLIEDWAEAGLDGFRLRPACLPHDLGVIASEVVPELQRRGRARTAYEPGTLRDRFELPRPANRYAA